MPRKSLRKTSLFLIFLASTLAASTIASAQNYKPSSIVADQVTALPDTTPDATPHFGCELRPFNLSRGLFCYGPAAIRTAYGIDQLLNAGFDGTGQTIVIVDAFGSPTIDDDLADFDAIFGLPAPPSFQQIRMPGAPPFDPTNADQVGWTVEIALDVQWAHAMAPGASIILVSAASDQFQDILDAQNYAINNRLGNILSESFGASEIDLAVFLPDILAANEVSYKRAVEENISTFVSAGDSGAEADVNGTPARAPQYPASSAFVTTVGGTNLFFGSATAADPNGTYQGEITWNESQILAGGGATGGGISSVFRLPNFQQHLPKATLQALGGHRGYPDVAYNAGAAGGVLVHIGTIIPAANTFFIVSGTSAGAPQWAAIGSIVDQVAGHPLGSLNKRIYKLGRKGALNTLAHDITVGNNSFDGITGFSATAGWDLTTGWGTPNVGLVPQIVGQDDDDND
jgi:subtilase family serine protease